MVLTKIAIATLVIGLVIGGGLGYMVGFGYSTQPTMESMEVGKESVISEKDGSMESKMESEKDAMKSGDDMSMESTTEPSMKGEKESMMSEKEG